MVELSRSEAHRRRPVVRLLLIAAACVALLGGCGDDESTDGATTTVAPGATTAPGSGEDTTTTAVDDESGTTTTTGSDEATPVTDPSGPDLSLFTVPECSVVPGGALSGADSLTIFVAVRNNGPGSVDRLVPVLISSDTGMQATSNTSISTGSAFSPMQIDVFPEHYGRAHRFTITADPDNVIIERDVTNNQLSVTVDLPERPTSATDVPCASP
jgi:hypothetical protein